MTEASTFLWFRERAEEAVRFYTDLIPNSEITGGVTLSSPQGHDITVTTFTLGGAPFQAMGAPDAGPFTTGISVSLTVEDQNELDRIWQAILDAGGRAIACGWIADQFGLSWQIVPRRYYELIGRDQRTAQRVAEALWNMTKIDVAGLEAAAG